jgi:hypothetical protein
MAVTDGSFFLPKLGARREWRATFECPHEHLSHTSNFPIMTLFTGSVISI